MIGLKTLQCDSVHGDGHRVAGQALKEDYDSLATLVLTEVKYVSYI